jgi:hypothetical protein
MTTFCLPPIPAPSASLPPATNNKPRSEVPVKWAPVPSNGKFCELTGLGHAYFSNKLLTEFRDKFVHVRLGTKSQKRAVTLYFLPSLHRALQHIAGNEAESETVDCVEHAMSTSVPATWLRPPASGSRCKFSGLSHGLFYDVLDQAGTDLQVAHLKVTGETRATRLVFLPSLHGFLVNRARQLTDAS